MVSRQILQQITEEQPSELLKQLAVLKEENRKLRSFNMKLQEELLHHLPEAQAEPAEPKSLQNSRPQPPAGETPPAFTLMGNGMVYLANSVTVTKEVCETLMAVPKDSHFIKRPATAIWSSEVLAQRSFSGTLSNRYLTDGSEKAA
ncbi:hypothetical protein MRX96_022327 [Rhipicephalus microplus]